MGKTKIIIKCHGFFMRTGDLKMAEGAIDHLIRHGIMNHSWVPNALLDRANKILDGAIKAGQLAINALLSRKKSGAEQPEVQEETKQLPEATIEQPAKKTKERKHPTMVNQWEIEEDKLIADYLGGPVKDAVKDPILKARHTKHAIKTRFSLFKNKRFDRLNKDRANMMQAYMSGKKVSTAVATINRRGYTPIVDAIEKRVASVAKRKKISKIKAKAASSKDWTDRELQILKDNPNMGIKELSGMLFGRSPKAIQVRRNRLGLPRLIGKTTWTHDQEEALRLNMHMKPKELMKLPWLKGMSANQINQKKHSMKKHAS